MCMKLYPSRWPGLDRPSYLSIRLSLPGLASHSPSMQEGLARVVPATWPEKQEHLTVRERSSTWFWLQQR